MRKRYMKEGCGNEVFKIQNHNPIDYLIGLKFWKIFHRLWRNPLEQWKKTVMRLSKSKQIKKNEAIFNPGTHKKLKENIYSKIHYLTKQ